MLNRTMLTDVMKLVTILFVVFTPQLFCWLLNSSNMAYPTNIFWQELVSPWRGLIILTLILLINSGVIYLWIKRYSRAFSV